MHGPDEARHRLREVLGQILLLVLTNVFVGGMVGLERTVLPLVAEADFGIASTTAAMSFIATFGLTKAGVNFFAGGLSDRWGRRRLLMLGWLVGAPVPLLLMSATAWAWVLVANALLGVNQALTWSMTVVMKVDLVPPRRYGLVIGWNEFAGYAGLAVVAALTGHIASTSGLRPEPFYLGIGLVAGGLCLSALTKDTTPHLRVAPPSARERRRPIPLREALVRGTFGDASLSAASLAGLATNLKDGALWGLLPIVLAARGLPIEQVGVIVALYPGIWAVTQLVFGPLSDRVGRRALITLGLVLQSIGVAGFVVADSYAAYLGAAGLTGLGTGMVYPTLLALVSEAAAPAWRASALGVYRLWRDLGYAVGAIGSGLVADALDVDAALWSVAAFSLLVAIGFAVRVADGPGRELDH